MNRKNYVLQLIVDIVGDKPTAEMVYERLDEEGFLHIGYGDAEIDRITKTFAELWGTTKTSRFDRFAATRLARAERYGGAEGIVGLMKLFITMQSDKYAPSVSTVQQFEEKLPAIVVFMRKKQQQNERVEL
jgi:hypothetical protein